MFFRRNRSVQFGQLFSTSTPLKALGTVAVLAMLGLQGAMPLSTAAATTDVAARPIADAHVAGLADLGENDVMNYAILYKAGDDAFAKKLQAEIKTKSGAPLVSYPEYGVSFAQFKGPKGAEWLSSFTGVEKWGPTRQGAIKGAENVLDSSSHQTPTGTESSSSSGAAGIFDSSTHDLVSSPKLAAGDATAWADHWGLTMIDAEAANKITQGSSQITVGIMDTGVDITNPALAHRVDKQRSVGCTDNGVPDQDPKAWAPTGHDGVPSPDSVHGTHVAGIVGAELSPTSSEQVQGVAPKTSMVAIATGNGDGFFYPEYVACGYHWALTHHINVLNHSYFMDPWSYWCPDQASQAAGMEAVLRIIKAANDKNIVSVVAAGNDSADLSSKNSDASSPNDNQSPTTRPLSNNCLDLPAEAPGIITVSAVAKADSADLAPLAGFSNFGEGKITVAAPGVGIISTGFGDSTVSLSGTSMASPFVTGVVALMLAKNPRLTLEQVTSVLKESATVVGTSPSVKFGAGVVNALKSVELAGKTTGKAAAALSTSGSDANSQTPAANSQAASGESSSMWMWVGGAVSVALVALAVLIVRQTKRRV